MNQYEILIEVQNVVTNNQVVVRVENEILCKENNNMKEIIQKIINKKYALVETHEVKR